MSLSRMVTVNGQLFNGQRVDGVEWEIEEITGLGDPAAVFTSEQNVARDGAWGTTGYRGPRAVGIVGVIRADDEVRAELAADRFRRLIALADFPIVLHYAAGDRTLWARRDGEVQIDSRDLPWEFHFSVVLKCLDPAIYAGDQSGSADLVRTTGLPHTSGGLTFPITFPITFTGASATGDIVLDLAGGGRLQLRIDGYVEQPQIIVENQLGTFRLAWFAVLSAGMWLDVDPATRTALLQGQSSRPPNVRLWPVLAPGVNTFKFRAGAYSPDAALTVTIRPTV